MLNGRIVIGFLLTYFMHTSAYQRIYNNFHELAEYEYELRPRIRRSSNYFTDPGDGVKNFGNKTNCNDKNRNSTENCTITEQFTDIQDHDYYRSYYYPQGSSYFVDLSEQAKSKKLKVEKHEKLSNSYKKAFRIPIDFHFPFYGNFVDKIIVTTGGFINIGPKFHSFVHKVHYIAPLMADFNPRTNNQSIVYVGKNSEMLIVQWTDFLLNGKENANKTFTFQISLHKNGTVIMAYKNIPISPAKIKIPRGNVGITVGFSDGFIITYKRYDKFKLVIHNLIYSYHKVNFPLLNIKNDVAYKLVLLPNCIQFKSCYSCLNHSKRATNFTCRWCPKLEQCSDALDWHRQRWLKYCVKIAYTDVRKCKNSAKDKIRKMKKRKIDGSSSSSTVGIIIGMILFMTLVVAGSIFMYAYTHPLSNLGLFLMVNRRPWKRFQKLSEDEYA